MANTLSRPPPGEAHQVASLCARPLVAAISSSGARDAQPPQVVSLCARPPAAVINHHPAGAAQQPQVASLYAQPPVAVNPLESTSVFLTASVDISVLSAAQGSCPEVAAMASKASLRVSSGTIQGCLLNWNTLPAVPAAIPVCGIRCRPHSGPPNVLCQSGGCGQACPQT